MSLVSSFDESDEESDKIDLNSDDVKVYLNRYILERQKVYADELDAE